MSKVLVIAIVAVVVLAIAFFTMPRSQNLPSERGTTSDIQKNIEGLLSSNDEMAFLILTVANTNKFVQFSASEGIVQMDFPMIEDEQIARRQTITEYCDSLGLKLTVNTGSDGSEFLDYNLLGSPQEIASMIVKVIEKVFDVTQTTELEFQAHGF